MFFFLFPRVEQVFLSTKELLVQRLWITIVILQTV